MTYIVQKTHQSTSYQIITFLLWCNPLQFSLFLYSLLFGLFFTVFEESFMTLIPGENRDVLTSLYVILATILRTKTNATTNQATATYLITLIIGISVIVLEIGGQKIPEVHSKLPKRDLVYHELLQFDVIVPKHSSPKCKHSAILSCS